MSVEETISKNVATLKSKLTSVNEQLKDKAHKSASQLTALRKWKKKLNDQLKTYNPQSI
jgi:hypothetical protein